MFHILMLLALGGSAPEPMENLATALAFRTREACYAEAARRAAVIKSAGTHGTYLCMYDREPDARLHRERIVDF